MKLSFSRWVGGVVSGAALAALPLLPSCTEPAPKVPPKYATYPLRQVPDYMKDSILQYTDLGGNEPLPVSGYALVANLDGTGGCQAPSAVRDYIVKDMKRHGFGIIGSGLGSTDDILNSRNFAIARVDGLIPPGARAGTDWWTWFDVRVTAIPQSETTSLSHGDVYDTELKMGGANPLSPGERVDVMAQARGPIFVNPSYALEKDDDSSAGNNSRRTGILIGGARPISNRPLYLRLRAPEHRLARAIEHRINEEFQSVMDPDLPIKGTTNYLADAQDEGVISVLVPKVYSNDWQHFVGVMRHTFMQGNSPAYAAMKARELAEIALQPDAPLQDISYAWEGLGKPALHAIKPLMNSPRPDVQFAAARAAAFIGDSGAPQVLASIASTAGNPFRVNAVKALGELPTTPVVDRIIRQLLESDEALVRIEAYRVLAMHKDEVAVYTQIVKKGDDEKFALDIVQTTGLPTVYASRQGIPRLAILGQQTQLNLPIMFEAMDKRLTISCPDDHGLVTIFYRGRKAIRVLSGPDLAEIAARLGGAGQAGNNGLDFSYGDVVAIIQALIHKQNVSGMAGSRRQLASFVLQEPTQFQELIDSAPALRDTGRPQTDTAKPTPVSAAQMPAQLGADVSDGMPSNFK